jgi:D-sedoheptulose 7-phosphate isomerase
MAKLNKTTNVTAHLNNLLIRYPVLEKISTEIMKAFVSLKTCYESSGKVIIIGNGGSAADSHHIVGELMKSFIIKRPIDNTLSDKLKSIDYIRGSNLSTKLEMPLPAISLVSQCALTSAYNNDVDSDYIYAQLLLGYGQPNDILLCISSSGNSENIINAAIVAKARNIKLIGLTGNNGGKLNDFSDLIVKVPEYETYKIQELHLPIYHCWCLMLEEYFFGRNINY